MTKKIGFFQRSELTAVLATFRHEFWAVAVFSGVANLLMLAPTLYMLQVFDRVLVSQSELTLLALSIITLFLFAVMAFAEWMRSWVLVRAGVRLDTQLSSRVFNASFDANLNQAGGNAPRAFGDLIQVRQFLTGNGVFAFFDTPWVPIYVGVLFILHPWLGYMAIVFALIQGALAWWGHKAAIAPSEAAVKASSDVTLYLQSKLRSSEVLEPMGMVGNLQAHWHARHLTYLAQSGHAQGVTHRITAVSKFIRYTQQSLALGMGALLVIDGQLSPGAMIAANVLTTRALAPIDMMVGIWRGFISAREAFARLETLLGQYPHRDAALKRVAPRGVLALRNVVATAPGRKTPILKNVSLDAAPGTVTVILGPSGSGKSTLARVILGIWPDVSGDVLLDDMPLQGWDRGELGPHIGYLPQDIELFEGNIAENIARFAELDPEKVIAAAKSAGLHDMILRLPKGYDTPIGEAGSLLSGGQRQRVGLARAIYGNPMLVVLDEPNANLDDVGESALMSTVWTLKAMGKTVLLITHRSGAIAAADQLVVLRDGAVYLAGPRDVVEAELRRSQAAGAAQAPTTRLVPAVQA
ncbi:MAG: type I secretion system permease/ATPase [Burkholderiales bacterium PBB4]|nr:MAG: type I secretion system permease/ATPase [Burkholderiales bacterium PBB4]